MYITHILCIIHCSMFAMDITLPNHSGLFSIMYKYPIIPSKHVITGCG